MNSQIINAGPSKEIWDEALLKSGIDPQEVVEYNVEDSVIQKRFSTKKEIQSFKKGYSSGEIKSEVILNLIQPFYSSKNTEINEYNNFKYSAQKDCVAYSGLLFFLENIAYDIAQHYFGKYDFLFYGNRIYKNWIFEFEGLTFIGPIKREVVSSNTIDNELISKAIRFEKAWQNMQIAYLFEHIDGVPKDVGDTLVELKLSGLIKENNEVNFEFLKGLKHDRRFY